MFSGEKLKHIGAVFGAFILTTAAVAASVEPTRAAAGETVTIVGPSRSRRARAMCCNAVTGSETAISGSNTAPRCASAQSARTSAAAAPCVAASPTKSWPSNRSPLTAMKRSPGRTCFEFRSILPNAVSGGNAPCTVAPDAARTSSSRTAGIT